MRKRTGKFKSCEICNTSFYAKPYQIKTRRFCSHTCYAFWKKGNPIFKTWLGKIRPDMTGKNNPMKRKDVRKKLSEIMNGRKFTDEHRKKLSEARRGIYKRQFHPNWKGGKTISGNGYIILYDGVKKYKYEHIEVMEKYLDRKIKKGEVVHHINGDIKDNRIENLMLFPSNADHLKYHRIHRLQIGA